MSADLVLHRPAGASLQVPSDIGEIKQYAELFAKSGYFQDAREMAQAAVKIVAGAECGVKPFASMNGIYIVKGRTSMSANLMATLVKSSGRYNYRIVEISTERCQIDFYEHSEMIGSSTFTMDDAKKAETQNLHKFARNMLFARAMSNGVRWFCPDVTAGPVYTPEELGEEVDGEGEMVRSPRPVQVVHQETIQHDGKQVDTTTGEIQEAEYVEAQAVAEPTEQQKAAAKAEAKVADKAAFEKFCTTAANCAFKYGDRANLLLLARTICKKERPTATDLNNVCLLRNADWKAAIATVYAQLEPAATREEIEEQIKATAKLLGYLGPIDFIYYLLTGSQTPTAKELKDAFDATSESRWKEVADEAFDKWQGIEPEQSPTTLDIPPTAEETAAAASAQTIGAQGR